MGDGPAGGGPSSGGRRGRRAVLIVAALIAVIALGGFGGKYAWDATAVERSCALQPDDVAAIARWQPTRTVVTYGGAQYPNITCDYLDQTSGGSGEHNTVSITTASTEAGSTPGNPGHCLSGAYWQGRGYACWEGEAGSAINPGLFTDTLTAVRLNGANTYGASVTCVTQVSQAGEQPSPQASADCFDELTQVMAAVTSKLGIQPEPVKQQVLALEDLKAQAATADAAAGTAGSTTDSGTTEPPTPESPTPETQAPQPSPVTPTPEASSTPPEDAKAQLDAAATEGINGLSMDGHWAIQLASKYDGVTDDTQTTANGSHTFHYADILAEYQALQGQFSPVPVVLIRGSDFASGSRNKRIYVTIADPGGLRDRAAALTWCKENFSGLTGKALLNVCYPRKLQHD